MSIESNRGAVGGIQTGICARWKLPCFRGKTRGGGISHKGSKNEDGDGVRGGGSSDAAGV